MDQGRARNRSTEKAAKLADLSETSGDAAPLLNLQRAALLADDGKIEESAKILQEMATTPGTPLLYQELATLKRVILLGNTLDSEARHNAIDALMRTGGAFRPAAMEQKALALVDDGDKEKAIGYLTSLLVEPEVTAAMRARVEQTLVVLGGEVPEIAQVLSNAQAQQ